MRLPSRAFPWEKDPVRAAIGATTVYYRSTVRGGLCAPASAPGARILVRIRKDRQLIPLTPFVLLPWLGSRRPRRSPVQALFRDILDAGWTRQRYARASRRDASTRTVPVAPWRECPELPRPMRSLDLVPASGRTEEMTTHDPGSRAHFAAAQTERIGGRHSSEFLGTTSVQFWLNSCPSPESDGRFRQIAPRSGPVGEVCWVESYLARITHVPT